MDDLTILYPSGIMLPMAGAKGAQRGEASFRVSDKGEKTMKAGMRAKGTLLYLYCFIVFLFVAPLALAQEAPTLDCKPDEGEYGLQFYIVGKSFESESVVSIEGFDLTLASRTDGEGNFKIITFAPTDESKFPVGVYEIIASDEAGGKASCTFRLREVPTPFRPTAAPQVETPTTLPPTSAAAPTVAPPLTPPSSVGTSPWLFIGLAIATALGLALLAFAIFMIVARNRPAPAQARPSSPPKAERPFSPSPPPSEPTPVRRPQTDVARDATLPTIQAAKEDATLVATALPVLTTQATLTVTKGVGKGARFTVDKKTTIIGRGDDCDIIVAEAVVSRHHTKIVRMGPKYFLYDLKSTNGTLVNGQRVEQHVLEDGDEIQIGVTVFLFEKPEEEG